MSHSTRRLFAAGVLAGSALFAVAGPAQAVPVTIGDIQVNLGGGSTETKIYLDQVDDPGTLVGTGHVGSQGGDPGTPVITFTMDQAAKFANGFAEISALPPSDGVYKSLTISVPTGWFFTDMDFSTHKASQVTFTAMNGSTTVGTYSDSGLSNGDLDWLLVAIHGKLLTSLILTSTDGFDQTKQFEISGLCSTDCLTIGTGTQGGETPLPGALWLFGSALAGAAGIGKWRRKRKNPHLS